MKTARTLGWPVAVVLALVACATPPAAPAADFGFTLADTTLAAVPGSSVTTSVTILPINGFSGTVALAVANRDGSPATGIALDPSSIAVTGTAPTVQSVQRQVAIDVDPAVANDIYDLRVTASSGGLSSDADISLTVADDLIPIVAITGPSDGATITGRREVTLSGTLSSLDPIIAVDVLGGADLIDMSFDQDAFSATIELEDNANRVSVRAMDGAGRTGVSPEITLSFPFLDLMNFQRAGVVVGQPDFFSSDANRGDAAAADTLSLFLGNPAMADTGVLFVPDSSNNRVLGFNQLPTGIDAGADFVLGQPDFFTTAAGTSATTLDLPATVHVDGAQLVVADTNNHRVLIWNVIPTTTQAPANVVVGQPDFITNSDGCDVTSLSGPRAAIIAAGKLMVADSGNNRILIWNGVPTTNGEPADIVIGQNSFSTCSGNDDDQDGMQDASPSARTLLLPVGLWSDGDRVVVTETLNNRVGIWNSLPATSFVPADVVVGQEDFVSSAFGSDAKSLIFPQQANSNGNQLFVVDASNNRILVFDTFPTLNGELADRVLGQASFTNRAANDDDQDGLGDGSPTARTFDGPVGVLALEGQLLVSDQANNRVLIFEGP